MATSFTFPTGFLSRTADPTWQGQLRACVRLYLSLTDDAALEQELDVLLQRSEEELLDYLLAGEVPTLAARQQARHFLDMAQCQLLSSPLEMRQLLAELAGT
jgi:hypothetical protein